MKLLIGFILISGLIFVACKSENKTKLTTPPSITVIDCNTEDCLAPLCEEIEALETDGSPKQVPKDYTGAIKVCSKKGRLFTLYYVLKGKINGEMLVYDEDGILGLRSYFVKGKNEGKSIYYDSKGKNVKTEIFLDGVKIDCKGDCDF